MIRLKPFLVVWDDRLCIEVREHSNPNSAYSEMMSINERYLKGTSHVHSNVYFASSRKSVEDDPACKPGGSLDDQFRDLMDWCSDWASGYED